MAYTTVSKFLYPANVEIAYLLQVSDLVDTENQIVSPVLDSCTKIAFSQAQTYCDVSFIKDNYKEKYNRVDYEFVLKNFPVTYVDSVKVNGTLLVEDTDYTVDESTITLIPTSETLVTLISASYGKLNAIVEYTGGFTSIDKLPALMHAVVTQSIVFYNRKSSLGLGDVQGAGFSNTQLSSIKGASDEGDMLSAVQSMLDPFVNLGDIQDVY